MSSSESDPSTPPPPAQGSALGHGQGSHPARTSEAQRRHRAAGHSDSAHPRPATASRRPGGGCPPREGPFPEPRPLPAPSRLALLRWEPTPPAPAPAPPPSPGAGRQQPLVPGQCRPGHSSCSPGEGRSHIPHVPVSRQGGRAGGRGAGVSAPAEPHHSPAPADTLRSTTALPPPPLPPPRQPPPTSPPVADRKSVV